jgi:hypothetical protein
VVELVPSPSLATAACVGCTWSRHSWGGTSCAEAGRSGGHCLRIGGTAWALQPAQLGVTPVGCFLRWELAASGSCCCRVSTVGAGVLGALLGVECLMLVGVAGEAVGAAGGVGRAALVTDDAGGVAVGACAAAPAPTFSGVACRPPFSVLCGRVPWGSVTCLCEL